MVMVIVGFYYAPPSTALLHRFSSGFPGFYVEPQEHSLVTSDLIRFAVWEVINPKRDLAFGSNV
jgi:hypothetical protein